MKYAVQMGSGAVKYTKFHIHWFRLSYVYREDIQTQRQQGDLINLLLFFFSK
jgi:hypothetical protein